MVEEAEVHMDAKARASFINSVGGSFCRTCGVQVKAEAAFCSQCGAPIKEMQRQEQNGKAAGQEMKEEAALGKPQAPAEEASGGARFGKMPPLPREEKEKAVSPSVEKEPVRAYPEEQTALAQGGRESAKADRTGKLASILRNHRVNTF